MIIKTLKAFTLMALIFTALLQFTPKTVQAHPLPNGVNHNTKLSVQSGNLVLSYSLLMFYTDLDIFYAQLTPDKLQPITDEQGQKWLEALKPKIYIESAGKKYEPLGISNFANYIDIKDNIYPTVNFDINFGPSNLKGNLEDFTFTNTYRIQSGDSQDWNFVYDIDSVYMENVKFPDGQTITGSWSDPKKSQSGETNGLSNGATNSTSTNFVYDTARSFLDTAVRDPQLSLPTILTLIFISILFGAAHTLTPGHGKSIIGAYMASIHGTWKDAVIMATSTTLSHTGIVILLGFVFVFLKAGWQTTIPIINANISIPALNLRSILPFLNVVSGMAIIVIGAWMFRARLKDYIALKVKQQRHAHEHQHGIEHDHHHNHNTNHSHSETHTHNHSHVHNIPDHRLSLRESIWLGMSTGLSPCIDAIAILILAINLDKIWLGIGIILAFSIGMAGTLVIIGWSVGAGLKGTKRFKWGQNMLEWLPMISSALIVVVGILLLIQTRG
jgi:ABC-type nickel/cobalt efflux system permease component RcnA